MHFWHKTEYGRMHFWHKTEYGRMHFCHETEYRFSGKGKERIMQEEYKELRLENQLCFPLYACAKEVTRRYKPFLDPLDLTYTQYITMMVMWEKKEVRVKDLGEVLYLDSGTLTPLLKRLEQKGLITRARYRDDERALCVHITEEGEKLQERAKSVPHSMRACIPLSLEEIGILKKLLSRTLHAMENPEIV